MVTSSAFHSHHFNKKHYEKEEKKKNSPVSEFPHLNCYSHSKARCFMLSKPPDSPAQLFKCTGRKKKKKSH